MIAGIFYGDVVLTVAGGVVAVIGLASSPLRDDAPATPCARLSARLAQAGDAPARPQVGVTTVRDA